MIGFLVFIILGAIVGAIIFAPDEPGAGAVIGAVCGMIIGAIVYVGGGL